MNNINYYCCCKNFCQNYGEMINSEYKEATYTDKVIFDKNYQRILFLSRSGNEILNDDYSHFPGSDTITFNSIIPPIEIGETIHIIGIRKTK